jgi:hypothetical protein
MSLDTPKILAALMIFGAIWLFVKKSKQAEPEEFPAKAESTAPKIFPNQKQLAQDQAESHQRSQLFVQERAAGLQALPVKRTRQGTFELQVNTRAFERGCMQGDLDVMKQDLALRKRREPGFRLSLENLDPASNMKPVQVPVSLAQLKRGFRHSMQIPITKERSMWGLFLCSAGSEKYCQRLSMNDIGKLGELQDKIRDRIEPPSRYPADDKVFFFQFLVSYPDRLLLHDSAQSLDESFSRLNQVLQSAKEKPVSPSLMGHVKTWLRSIGSLPAMVHSSSLEIQLPYRGAKCP